MSNEHEALADQVVETFQSLLDTDIRDAIGNENFTALNEMVREALSEHTAIILGRFDEVIKNLRAEIEKPEIEL